MEYAAHEGTTMVGGAEMVGISETRRRTVLSASMPKTLHFRIVKAPVSSFSLMFLATLVV
jgi:hypothetical protein